MMAGSFVAARALALLVPPGEVPALQAALMDGFGLAPDQVVDQAALKDLLSRKW